MKNKPMGNKKADISDQSPFANLAALIPEAAKQYYNNLVSNMQDANHSTIALAQTGKVRGGLSQDAGRGRAEGTPKPAGPPSNTTIVS